MDSREPWCCSPLDDLMLSGGTEARSSADGEDDTHSPRTVLTNMDGGSSTHEIKKNRRLPIEPGDALMIPAVALVVDATDYRSGVPSRTGTPVMDILGLDEQKDKDQEEEEKKDTTTRQRLARKRSVASHRTKYKMQTCESWTSTQLQSSSTASCNASQTDHLPSNRVDTEIVVRPYHNDADVHGKTIPHAPTCADNDRNQRRHRSPTKRTRSQRRS
jgi:hypothetical protein